MTPPTPTRLPRAAPRSLGVFVIAAVCLLACTVPAIVGLTMFGAPTWLAVGTASAVAIAVVRGRRKGGGGGC